MKLIPYESLIGLYVNHRFHLDLRRFQDLSVIFKKEVGES